MNETLIRCVQLASQALVVVVCGVLIALGKDSIITDLFMAGAGSILGVGIWQSVKSNKTNSAE